MYWPIWPWCFKIYRPSKIFTGHGLLAVVFHKPSLPPVSVAVVEWNMSVTRGDTEEGQAVEGDEVILGERVLVVDHELEIC